MNKLDNSELMLIVGGFSITGTIINALTSAGKFIYSLGQSLGTSIRRISSNNLCTCSAR